MCFIFAIQHIGRMSRFYLQYHLSKNQIERHFFGKCSEVDIPGEQGTYIRSSPELTPVSGDAIMFGCIDSEGHEAILVVISRIVSKENREIIFSGKKSLKEGEESLASVKICDFKTEPVEFFMENQGEVAIKFQPPENLTVKSVRLKMV
jgi:hypothetical protein